MKSTNHHRIINQPIQNNEIKYKENSVKGLELMSSVNTTLRDQHFVDTETENHEMSHEEQVELPITEHEPTQSHEEQVEHPITEQLQRSTELETHRLGLTSGQKGKKRRVESSEKHFKSSRRYKHSKSYRIMREKIFEVRKDEQHKQLSQQLNEVKLFFQHLYQVRNLVIL